MTKNPIQTAEPQLAQAFVNFADKETQKEAFEVYAKAQEEAYTSVANTRDYRGLTSRIDGRPGVNGSDFDWFRPGQAAPVRPKDIIAFARYAYRRIGLIHNAIDLMGDFACQGIRLTHPNKKIEAFHSDWFNQVEGSRVSERLGHLLFREANVPVRWYTAKINPKKRREMQRSIAAADVKFNIDDPIVKKNEIPWRYNFIDPLLVEPMGGSLTTLSNKKVLKLKIPERLRSDITSLIQSSDPEAKKVLAKISPDILRAVQQSGDVILPADKTHIYYYKKDDWQAWADPMTYSAFEPLNLYQRLQLTDKAALDGAMNKIRVWKIGSMEHGLAPTPASSAALGSLLGANVGGGTIDIVWGPDIQLLETSSDIQSYLGEDKYKPTLMAIYASLGIPPTLTGTFGASGTTNNFIALKTLVERLNYVRKIIVSFWNEQLRIVQKAMGFRKPAIVEFDIMYLEDPAAMTTLLLNMADRNIISDEFVQRNIKAVPEIENNRIGVEKSQREKMNLEKVSPYHQADKEYEYKKIALQTGITTPSEIGLELEEKKEGERSALDIRESSRTNLKNDPPTGTPGRPKNSRDKGPRQEKTFQPKTKASAWVWAKATQSKISDVINPVVIKGFKKNTLRDLTKSEFDALEDIKFNILCNLTVGQEFDPKKIHGIDPASEITKDFGDLMTYSEENFGKLSIDQIRDLRISYYIYNYYEK